MAHFFNAWPGMSKANAVVSAKSPGISTLQIPATGVGTFGVYGGDGAGNWLTIRVYRGSAIVSDGAKPAVPVKVLLEDAGEWVRVLQATGLKAGDEIYGMTAAGQRYTSALTVKTVAGKAADAMQDWADHLKADASYKPTQAGLCPLATPYLALKKGGNTAPKLRDEFVGGPISTVHGLAVHTTGAGGNRDAFDTAINGCVGTWHFNKDTKGFLASTHFAIAADGTIVQIIPTNRQAWAQGNPGDRNWISVEVDNDGSSPMKIAQLESVKRLFGWICSAHGVMRQLAMGTLYFKTGAPPWKKAHDEITTTVCGAGGSQTTTDPMWAALSRGLSCHYWLDPRNGKPCPGAGILRQLASIVKPGPVS